MINVHVQNFIDLIETDRERMDGERLTMTDLNFANRYMVSPHRVTQFLGRMPKKQFTNPRRVMLDKAAVHKHRLEGMSDTAIATLFHTSNQQVGIQCGNRKMNGITPLSKKGAKLVNYNYIEPRSLNTKSWVNPTDWNEYWRSEGDIIQHGEGPIYILKEIIW